MDLRQLRYLIAVVEERSVSGAAARLNMSQPPLSNAIARMERELGVQLLERHARGVEPTEAGTYLAENARRLLAISDEVFASVVAVGTGRKGSLTLAAVSGTSWELLPAALKTFAQDRPDVDIEVLEFAPAEVVDQVKAQRADAGLVHSTSTRYIERLYGADLEVAMVRRQPLAVVLPPHLAQIGGVDLTRLADERWLVSPDDAGWPELPDLVHEAWHRAGISPPHTYTIATLDAAVQFVAAGFGVALTPADVSRIARPDVAVRPLAQHLPPLESAVIWRRHERPSPVLARFLRAVMSTPEPDRLGPSVRPDEPVA